MKQNMKVLIGVCLIVVLGIIYLATPSIRVYALVVYLIMTPGGDLDIDPNVFLETVAPAQMISKYSLETCSVLDLNVSQILVSANLTAKNVNETVFFSGSFTFDSLAQQKIVLLRDYDASLKTATFTLYVDALVKVDFADDTPDIMKEFHKSFVLTFP